MRQSSPIHTYATFWHSSCFPSIAKRKVEASVDVQCFNFENVPNPGDFNIESVKLVCKAIPLQYIPLLLLRMEPSVPKTAKAKSGLTSRVSKIGGIIFLNKFK